LIPKLTTLDDLESPRMLLLRRPAVQIVIQNGINPQHYCPIGTQTPTTVTKYQ